MLGCYKGAGGATPPCMRQRERERGRLQLPNTPPPEHLPDGAVRVPNNTPPEHLSDGRVAWQRARHHDAAGVWVVLLGLLDHQAQRHAQVDLYAGVGLGVKLLGSGLGRRNLIVALARSRSRSRS